MATGAQRLSRVGMALILVLALGCAQTQEFGPKTRCVLPDQVSTAALVAHVNQNVARIQSWRTLNAEISSPDLPFRVAASVAVEAPRNFRMVVRSPLGPEVDVGSNLEHYWFWSRQDESKRIYLASHDPESAASQPNGMPFQPEWIMEAMGVIALDPARLQEVARDPQARTVTLSEERLSPQGEPVRKLTVVDLCHGLVREHALVDSRGNLIARAQLLDPVRDKASGGIIPSRVHMVWPQARLDMTMALRSVEVNTAISRSTFTMQQYKGCEVFQVGGEQALPTGALGSASGP